MTILIGWIVIGVVSALFLTGTVLSLTGCCGQNPSVHTRVMLVLLRLAIGWHFFVEGMEKLNDPSWSGAGYLREAEGPLAPRFHKLAGDPIDEKFPIVNEQDTFKVEVVASLPSVSPAEKTVPPSKKNLEFDPIAPKVKKGDQVIVKVSGGKATKATVPAESKLTVTVNAAGNEIEIKADKDAPTGTVDIAVEALKIDLGPIHAEHQKYIEAVKSFYHLDSDQITQLDKDLEPVLKESDRLLTKQPKLVEKTGAHPPSYRQAMTVMQRIEQYRDCQKKADEIEKSVMAHYGSEGFESWKAAKADASRWRSELLKDLTIIDNDIKRTIRTTLLQLAVAKLSPEQKAKLNERGKRKEGGATIGQELMEARRSADKEFISSISDGMSSYKTRLLEDVKKWQARPGTNQDLLEQSDQAVIEALKQGEFCSLATDLCNILGKSSSASNACELAILTRTLVMNNVDADFDLKSFMKNIEEGKKFTNALCEKLPKAIPESRKRLRLEWGKIDSMKEKQDVNISGVYRAFFLEIEIKNDPKDKEFLDDSFVKLVRENVLGKRRKGQSKIDPLPYALTPPVLQWTLLNWSDFIVKYGVLAVGVMLLAGLLARTACVAGAGFLLMFFLAMPSLPGWPESPKVEGHYLFINKNVIEMLALLMLATTRSGCWLGVNGLLQFLCPKSWRSKQECVKM